MEHREPLLPKAPVSAEDLETWLDQPVTRWILQALRTSAEEQKQAWVNHSWDSQTADPQLLKELATRADAYLAVEQTDYLKWCEIHGHDPVTQ